MKRLTIDGCTYSIFFRYLSRYGKSPHFRKHAPFQAITICTIQADAGRFTAQDVAVCSLSVAPKPTPAMRELLRLLKAALGVRGAGVGEAPDVLLWLALDRVEAELHPDQYSRREGRLRSLVKTIDRCGRLRKVKMEFLVEYSKLDPEPIPPERVPISEERKEELAAAGRDAGQEGILERRLQRKAARLRSQSGGSR